MDIVNLLLEEDKKYLVEQGYIELRNEGTQDHRKPIQGYLIKKYHGVINTSPFFAEWDSFDEAIEWLRHGHNHPIVIGDKVYTKPYPETK